MHVSASKDDLLPTSPFQMKLKKKLASRYNYHKVRNGDWSTQDESDDKQPKWLPKGDQEKGQRLSEVNALKIPSNLRLRGREIKTKVLHRKVENRWWTRQESNRKFGMASWTGTDADIFVNGLVTLAGTCHLPDTKYQNQISATESLKPILIKMPNWTKLQAYGKRKCQPKPYCNMSTSVISALGIIFKVNAYLLPSVLNIWRKKRINNV